MLYKIITGEEATAEDVFYCWLLNEAVSKSSTIGVINLTVKNLQIKQLLKLL